MRKQKSSGIMIGFRLLLMIGLLLIASVIGYFFQVAGFPETNIVLVYLLAVLLTSCLTKGYTLGILASIVATFTFNYFFTKPYFSFSVYDLSYMITFVIMTATALITSTLTSRVKQNAIIAIEKEAEMKALYTLTNYLTDAKDIGDISGIVVRVVGECFECRAACLCFDEDGIPEQTFIQQVSSDRQVRRKIQDVNHIKHQIEELRTAYDEGVEFWDWPIYGRENILGTIRIPKENAQRMNEVQIRLLRSMIESVALAMDRFRSAQQRMKSHEETIQERYRGNLLRAISHDLRTPLASIIGTSQMLMDMTQQEDSQFALAEGIHKDAEWLHSLVENILSLTRLQDGKLVLQKQMEAVEEVIGGAVAHISKRSPEYEITVNVPQELLLVPMDAKLIQQVLINLLDNAVKHTPLGEEISVFVKKDNHLHNAVFSVRDRGRGIEAADLSVIFQPFYTSYSKLIDARRGIGLGLTICEAIIKAHGGTIEACNHTDGQGAEFVFTLPLEVKENE